MESPGQLIREARRRRGLSPEEVFRIARIRPGLLENVEADLLSAVPEDPYARGLYASLAQAVGADVDRVLTAYDHLRSTRGGTASRETPREEPEEVESPRPRARFPRGPKSLPGAKSPSSRPLGAVIAIVAVLLVVGLIWIGSDRQGETGGGPGSDGAGAPEASHHAAPAAAPAARTQGVAASTPLAGESPLAGGSNEPDGLPPLVASPAKSSSAPAAAPALDGEDAAPPPPTDLAIDRPRDSHSVKLERVAAPREGDHAGEVAPGATVQPLDSDLPAMPGVTAPEAELILEARSIRNTWLRVVIDGTRARAGILPAGETRSWRARNEIRLDASAVEDVRFRLNGRLVDLGDPRRGVGHFLLSWDDSTTTP